MVIQRVGNVIYKVKLDQIGIATRHANQLKHRASADSGDDQTFRELFEAYELPVSKALTPVQTKVNVQANQPVNRPRSQSDPKDVRPVPRPLTNARIPTPTRQQRRPTRNRQRTRLYNAATGQYEPYASPNRSADDEINLVWFI